MKIYVPPRQNLPTAYVRTNRKLRKSLLFNIRNNYWKFTNSTKTDLVPEPVHFLPPQQDHSLLWNYFTNLTGRVRAPYSMRSRIQPPLLIANLGTSAWAPLPGFTPEGPDMAPEEKRLPLE